MQGWPGTTRLQADYVCVDVEPAPFECARLTDWYVCVARRHNVRGKGGYVGTEGVLWCALVCVWCALGSAGMCTAYNRPHTGSWIVISAVKFTVGGGGRNVITELKP